MHPVFRKLIDVKWRRFGKMRCLLQVALHVIFVVIWTIVGVSLPRDYKYYEPIKERWWNITLESIVVLWTLYFIFLVSLSIMFCHTIHLLQARYIMAKKLHYVIQDNSDLITC